MPFSAVFENLEAGASIDEIVEQFDITPEEIKAVIELASRSLDTHPSVPMHLPVPTVNAHFL